MKRSSSIVAIALAGVVVSLGFGSATTAVEKVREGIRLFSDGEFDAARKAFTEADVAEPDDPTIAFNRGCALAANGETDKARELFQQSALARETDLAARSHYNLGCLSAEKGRSVLGKEPINATADQREQGLSSLLAAVGHYRDCLRLDAEHADARHNLELIRLFVKHIQAQWQQKDREKARDEMGLLDFLAMIEQRQTELRATVRILNDQPDSPQRRQSTNETSEAQNELQEEIEPLKKKIEAELQTAAQHGAGNTAAGQKKPSNPQAEQVKNLLTQLSDEAGKLMGDANEQIEAADFEDAEKKQKEVLDRLNQIFMAIAPFSNILQRATQQQEQLTSNSESLLEAEDENSTQADADKNSGTNPDQDQQNQTAKPQPDADYPDLQWQQSRVTDWSHMLSLKAQSQLPQVEQQLKAAESQGKPQDLNPVDPKADPNAAQPDPMAQLEALKKSLEKAIELGPQIVEHSTSAAGSLGESKMKEALPDQQEALKLLREIAEPLAQQNQQQNQQQNNDENHNDRNQQQQKKNQKNEQQKQKQSRQQRAMSVLRRAREREREHRKLQKQLQQLIGGGVSVDRDW